MKYIRDPNCECSKFRELNEIPFTERVSITEYCKDGYMYSNGKVKECTCHKAYRGISKYEIMAKQNSLPTFEQLGQFKYKGDSDCYNKLKVLPSKLIDHPQYSNTIIYVAGPEGNQKTTSCAKVLCNVLKTGKVVMYIDFNALAKRMLDLDYDDQDLRDVDLLIVDNCFSGETINFKSTYNAIFDIVLKRHNPTILIASKKLEDIIKEPNHYDPEVLGSMQNRIMARGSAIYFPDNIDNIKLKEQGPVDLWKL